MSRFDEGAADYPASKPALEDVTQSLLDEETAAHTIIPSTIVYGLSDLTTDEWRVVQPVWRGLSTVVKHRVMRALNESSEALFELSFREIAFLSLDDESSLVRSDAIELLWVDESVETMRKLMVIAETDLDTAVRARALESLGRFILLGEYGDIPADLAAQAPIAGLRHTYAADRIVGGPPTGA